MKVIITIVGILGAGVFLFGIAWFLAELVSDFIRNPNAGPLLIGGGTLLIVAVIAAGTLGDE
jgi:hypothetical protein